MKIFYKQLTILLLVSAAFFSCKKDKLDIPIPEVTGEGFVIQTTPGSFGGVSTMHYLTSVEKGSADVAYGQEIPTPYVYEISYGRNGAYYIMADGLSKFTRFVPDEKGIMRESASLFISSFPSQTGVGGHYWYDDNTLLIWSYGFNGVPNLPVSYALINVSGSMQVLKKGSFQIPFSNNLLQQSVDFAVKRGDKLFLGYHELEVGGEIDSTGVKVAVLDANSLTYQKTIVDTRSELSGYGFITMASAAENGDIYIIPEARIPGEPSKPSAVLRIKAGETDFDPAYFFELNPVLEGNDARGLYYIGNGKILTKVWNKNIGNDINDYFNGKVWEEYLVDINTKTAVKLNAPVSQGYATDFVQTKSGKWAFVINTATGNYIYTYDPVTSTTAKGLEYFGVSTIDAISGLQIMFKKIIKVAHLWLGLASGLIIFVVAITGATYVFYNEITDVVEHKFRFVEPLRTQKLPLWQVQKIGKEKAEALAGKTKPERWDWISIMQYNVPDRSVIYSCRKYENPDALFEVFINPYTGNVLHVRKGEGEFWEIVVGLHTQLLLGNVGRTMVDYGTLVFLFMIISGMILWWPKNKAARKQRFSVKWNASPKRLNYDLHNVLGFYMCWIVIFCVITGIIWVFDPERKMLFTLLDGKEPVYPELHIDSTVVAKDNQPVLNKISNSLYRLYPDAYMTDFSLSQDVKDPYSLRVWKKAGQNSFAESLAFHPVSGEIIQQQKFKDRSRADKFNDMTSDLHYGWILGLPTKVLMFFACLIAASLPFTGFYIWWGRNRKKGRKVIA